MKKPTFQRCLRAAGSMASAQRHDLKVAIGVAGQERPSGRGGLSGGESHRLSSLPPSGDPAMGARGRTPALPVPGMQTHLQCVDEHASWGSSSQGPLDVFFLEKFNEGESVRKAAWRCEINLTGVSDLPPMAVRRRSLQAVRMSAFSRRLGRNSLWVFSHDKGSTVPYADQGATATLCGVEPVIMLPNLDPITPVVEYE